MNTLSKTLITVSLSALAATSAFAKGNKELIDTCKTAAPQELNLSADTNVRFKAINGSGRVKRITLRVSESKADGYNVQFKINTNTLEIKSFDRK